MNFNTIPQTLRQTSRWILWGKDKQPYSVTTRKYTDATNLTNGVSYEQAVNALMKETKAQGIGFLLGEGIVGIDIDEAFDDKNCLKNDAAAIVEMLKPCYVERSPSGRGIHILGFGVKNTSSCKRQLSESKGLEVYDKDRYFTVTGDTLPASEPDLTDIQSQLITFCDTFFSKHEQECAVITATDDSWTDEEVLAAIRNSPTHVYIFEDLWNGDTSRYNNDPSSADAALVERLLFFSGGNEQQTDRLFRQSNLMRDKWDEMRGRQTYGELTIKQIKKNMLIFRCRHRPLTEVGAAERFVDQYGDRIQFCHDWGSWLIWDGARWAVDQTGTIIPMVVRMIRNIPKEAQNMDEDSKKAYAKFSKSLEKNRTVSNVLKQSESLVPALSKDLDANQWKINCLNGMLDLATGKLWPHDPRELNTKIIPVVYDPNAQCPRYNAFLHEAMCGDEELIEFMDQFAGITLTGSVREQCFVVLYGNGNNGKSVELNIRRAIMGDYGKTAPPNVFIEKKQGDGIPNDLADLQGTRLVVDSETKEQVRFNEQRIKAVTGGEPIKARFLHREFFEYVPQFKLWIASNHRPAVSGTDKGFWRRIRLIPFNAVIPEKKKILDLDKIIIQEELPGILNRALQGCLRWQKAGRLFTPEKVLLATEEYRKDMDIIGQFIEECCEMGTGYSVMKAELYEAYRRWAISSGHKVPLTSMKFSIKMKERNLFGEREHRNLNGKHSWEGIRLKSVDDFL